MKIKFCFKFLTDTEILSLLLMYLTLYKLHYLLFLKNKRMVDKTMKVNPGIIEF